MVKNIKANMIALLVMVTKLLRMKDCNNITTNKTCGVNAVTTQADLVIMGMVNIRKYTNIIIVALIVMESPKLGNHKKAQLSLGL